jgi:hypothetical protein
LGIPEVREYRHLFARSTISRLHENVGAGASAREPPLETLSVGGTGKGFFMNPAAADQITVEFGGGGSAPANRFAHIPDLSRPASNLEWNNSRSLRLTSQTSMKVLQ